MMKMSNHFKYLCGIFCLHDYGRYLLSCRFSWHGNDFIGCDYYFFKGFNARKETQVHLRTEQPYKEVVFLCSSINLINFKIESL